MRHQFIIFFFVISNGYSNAQASLHLNGRRDAGWGCWKTKVKEDEESPAAMYVIYSSVCWDGWFNLLHIDSSMCNRCAASPVSLTQKLLSTTHTPQ